MPFKIIRDDITKVKGVDAIVNTANSKPVVGPGCDSAVYEAAGKDQLLQYRINEIGNVPVGEVFKTPSFGIDCGFILHAVSPTYNHGRNEALLRKCYANALNLAIAEGATSIAFPLISSGSFGYPKEEALRVAVDEISNFVMTHELMVYLVVFDEVSTSVASRISSEIDAYIDSHYVEKRLEDEYPTAEVCMDYEMPSDDEYYHRNMAQPLRAMPPSMSSEPKMSGAPKKRMSLPDLGAPFVALRESLDDRLNHMSDTFSEYLMYLIKSSGMKNSEVYIRAGIDKKVFSKIKNNRDYHPSKMTAMCLCVGAKLNIDQTRDLLSRAGYALSPSDKTDVIFSYFIEMGIYDLIEIDLVLEEKGLPYLIA